MTRRAPPPAFMVVGIAKDPETGNVWPVGFVTQNHVTADEAAGGARQLWEACCDTPGVTFHCVLAKPIDWRELHEGEMSRVVN